MRILIAGDFCPQNRTVPLIENGNFAEIWNNFPSISSKADYCILNFECPIVEHSCLPIKKCGPSLKCTPNAIKAIKYAGFDCVTLANNHFLDYGETGVKDTLDALKKEKIDYVGGGRNLSEASRVLFKEIDGAVLAIVNCCEHEFSIATEMSAGSNPLNPIQQYYSIREARNKADFVIVIVHGGHEMCQLPSPRMKETYRFFIEVGADVVVNHHQHCYSGYEVYKEKPIFYGLGNFLFDWDGRRNNIWNEGYIVSLFLSKMNNPSFELIPYIQCNETPSISLMINKNDLRFKSKQTELCSIISDDERLEKEYHNWLCKHKKDCLSIFQPYRGRVLNSLFMRGLLPSFVAKSMKYKIIDFIECESHSDKLKYITSKFL